MLESECTEIGVVEVKSLWIQHVVSDNPRCSDLDTPVIILALFKDDTVQMVSYRPIDEEPGNKVFTESLSSFLSRNKPYVVEPAVGQIWRENYTKGTPYECEIILKGAHLGNVEFVLEHEEEGFHVRSIDDLKSDWTYVRTIEK